MYCGVPDDQDMIDPVVVTGENGGCLRLVVLRSVVERVRGNAMSAHRGISTGRVESVGGVMVGESERVDGGAMPRGWRIERDDEDGRHGCSTVAGVAAGQMRSTAEAGPAAQGWTRAELQRRAALARPSAGAAVRDVIDKCCFGDSRGGFRQSR